MDNLVFKTNKYEIRLSETKSQAFLRIYDLGRLVNQAEVLSFVKSKLIKGYNEELIKDYVLQQKFNEDFLIAEGKEVENGLDSRLDILVDLEPHMNPEMHEDGTVDFKNIRSFPTVKQGVDLAKILPPTKGEDGIDVFGEVIKAKDGEETEPPIGNNIKVDPERPNFVVAEKAGHILLTEDGVLEIRDILIVDGDVDYGVGNIDFDGTVKIEGDVKSNFHIKAAGTIEITGTVEDAIIECDQSIVIKGGFLGKKHGKITAKGDVTVHHVDNQVIETESSLIIGEESMNADLRAEKEIKVIGKKGSIIGGFAYAGQKIETKNLGIDTGVQTIVSVGISKKILERIRELSLMIEKNEENLEKIKKNSYTLFRAKLDNKLPAEKEKLLEHLKKAQLTVPKQIEKDKAELEEVRKLRDKYKYSHISVSNTVFPKVRVVIAEDSLEVRNTYRQAVFRYEKGAVSLFIKGKRIKL